MKVADRRYSDPRLVEAGVFPAEAPEQSANLCPECDNGIVTIFHSHLRDWETGEYLDIEEVPCTACEDGLLYTPAEVVAIDWENLDAYHYTLTHDYDVDTEAA